MFLNIAKGRISFGSASNTVIGFQPTDLPNLIYWVDPSDNANNLFNGSAFSVSKDKSGNVNDWTQGAPLNQPTLSNFPNGRQCYGLDGVNTYMTRLALDIGTSFTLCWAGVFNIAATRMYILSKAGSGGGMECGTQFVEWYDGINFTDFSATGQILNTPLIFMATMGTPGTSAYYINNVSISQVGSSGASWTGGFSIIEMFRRANNDFYISGKCGDVLCYSDIKSASDRLQIYNYMSAKWT